MMRAIKARVYLGRDNVLRFGLLSDREPIADLSAIARVRFTVGGQVFDSDEGAAITWANTGELLRYDQALGAMTPMQINVIEMRLGPSMALAPGVYGNCSLVTWDDAHPLGLEWAGEPPLTVEVV